jgi:small-conductance mechanosensitive channel
MDSQQTVREALSDYPELLGQLAEFVLVAAVLYGFGRLVVEPAVRWLLARRAFEPTLEHALEKVLRVSVGVFALALAAWLAGLTAFLGGSALVVAALTLAVGFAAQDILSNFVAGVFIVQDRNFNIGDWIEWQDRAGSIQDIGFRVSRIRTFDNETITVPNTDLATSAVTNRMSNDQLRLSYGIGIGYTDDIDEVTRILIDSAAEDDGILADPEPSVRVTGLGDSAVHLQSRFWIADPGREDFSRIRSRYIQTVKERCGEAGIDLSTTTQHDLSGEIAVQDAAGVSS